MPNAHVKATVNGTTVAESDTYESHEGNIYFPPSAIKAEYFTKTDHQNQGASYYTIKAGDAVLENAAWYYPDTTEQHRDHVAFDKANVVISLSAVA